MVSLPIDYAGSSIRIVSLQNMVRGPLGSEIGNRSRFGRNFSSNLPQLHPFMIYTEAKDQKLTIRVGLGPMEFHG